MNTSSSQIPVVEKRRPKFASIPHSKWLEYGGLAIVLLLAAYLLFTNLNAIGYGNTYYTAAIKAMLQSWHNFFFVAAEPGGSVTVDKPPVGFWLEAISAFIFGVNGFAVVLPQILAGLGSIVVLYHLIRRKYGTVAGLLAGLALAITPVAIATERNNTIDSTLVFTLLLAAWAFIKATESRQMRYMLLGAFLVGIGFNIKMLEAYLPLPAFYALYFVGSADKVWSKLGKLALTSLLLLGVSFSWAVAVDLTPSNQRPYVGSSGDNSEMSLIFGYNGIDRLLGMFIRRQASTSSSLASLFTGSSSSNSGYGLVQIPFGGGPGGGGGFDGGDGGRGGGFPGGGGGGAGGFNIGQPGVLRLFTYPLANEASWLLPFAILGGLLVAFRNRLRWPLDSQHQDLVLWGGWLLTVVVFFSIAGFFHEYYLLTMAAPLAALVAIGAIGLWQVFRQRPWLGFGLLLVGSGCTLLFQSYAANLYIRSAWWLPYAAGLLGVGLAVMLVGWLLKLSPVRVAGIACMMTALLITPGIWSYLTNRAASNQTLPTAYMGSSGSSGGFTGGFGGDQVGVNQALLTYLEQNTQGMRYMLAVDSSMQGAGYVIATGRGVLYMGGFGGADNVVNSTDLANLVAAHQLRYIELGGFGGGGGNSFSDISSWVSSNCKVVQNVSAGNSFGRGFGGAGGLYDCGS